MSEGQSNHLDTIQELLCRFLSPVGAYRLQHVKPSKGRRWKKLQRRKTATTADCAGQASSSKNPSIQAATEVRPDILQYLTVGFNSTMRCLESSCRETMPDSVRRFLGTEEIEPKRKRNENQPKKELAAVFVCRSSLPASLYASVQQAVDLASKGRSPDQKIQFVPLPRNAEVRLAKAMNLPRVGIVGLAACESASVMLDYIREQVPQ